MDACKHFNIQINLDDIKERCTEKKNEKKSGEWSIIFNIINRNLVLV